MCLPSKAWRLASLSSGTATNVSQGHDPVPLSKGVSAFFLSGVSTSPAVKFPGAQTCETALQDQRLDQLLKLTALIIFPSNDPSPRIMGPTLKALSHFTIWGWQGADPLSFKLLVAEMPKQFFAFCVSGFPDVVEERDHVSFEVSVTKMPKWIFAFHVSGFPDAVEERPRVF
jgi:hypothetical protein